MRNDGGAAFPGSDLTENNTIKVWQQGMTMRQWYKGMASEGVVMYFVEQYLEVVRTNQPDEWKEPIAYSRWHMEKVAEIEARYRAAIADAMIVEDLGFSEKGEEPSEKKAAQRAEDIEIELTHDCSACGNFFEFKSPEDTKCNGCLQEEAEEAHDAGECVEDCPVCAEEKGGEKGEGDGNL